MSHKRFGSFEAKTRPTRSSCTGGPEQPFFEPRFLPNALHHRFSEQIRQAVRSDIDSPASRASSARNR
ncbi:hypothetical protein CS378_24605 [Rhodococcus ruber]|nr:hypothetical protein CS378_24605 [Rhodococcus ruber]KDE14508.1 hypothetical protein N505_0106730 [Rhodococcus aetherivorans]